jgi:tRNA-modifying protein YgfZ
MAVTALRAAGRPREFVAVRGPDAASYLQAMVSNDVEALGIGDACEALLLTPKGRVIAPLVVWRRGEDDFLLLTEPELGETVRTQLMRARFAAKVEIEPEQHESWLVLGGDEVLDERPPCDEATQEEVELWRIESRIPLWGRELDDTILPAEAGLEQTHISFSKGCYPGQEPIARQHHRGKVNRRLRVLEVEDTASGDELTLDGKVVGRITSAANGIALGYVRTEVPDTAELTLGAGHARMRPA